MTFAERASASAQRVVRHFSGGQTVTLKELATGTLGSDLTATPTVTAVTVSCTLPTPYGQALRDGERVRDGDLKILVWKDDPALTFVPAVENVAEIDGDSYAVVAVEHHAGAYELRLRGGGS